VAVPTYSYACTECSNRFDAVQAFTDDALTECPECSGRLRKLFGSVGVVFKGSGFYRTDSRAAANGSSNGEKKSSTESTGDSSATKSGGESKSSGDSKSSGESKSSTATPATVAS
jgi:putative FmdB family regulatory protein